MADNTDEEHLDNPKINQSENPPDEITPAADTETINPNQETENMEVHHHAHDPAMPHHKKNWKSYFWEFLMLFLAVFCGFLAENQREHMVEHKKEKEFMQSMIDDLKIDTATLAKTLEDLNRSESKIDSAIRLYSRHENQTDSQVIAIFRLIEDGFRSHFVIFTNRTSQQLKYSGSMRLIRNKIVADSLIAYWNKIERIENIYDRLENYRIDAIKLGFRIFNLPKDSTLSVKISPLLDNSPKLFGEYMNNWAFINRIRRNIYSVSMKNQISSGERLIELISKEYHIE
jgi:hypothetical protein